MEAASASPAEPSAAEGGGTLRTAPLRSSGATSRGGRAYLASLQRLGAAPEMLDEARRGWPGDRRRTPRTAG